MNRFDLVNLENYSAYIKLAVDGIPRTPFSMTTLAPKQGHRDTAHTQKVIGQSRARHGRPRHLVEEKYARWAGS